MGKSGVWKFSETSWQPAFQKILRKIQIEDAHFFTSFFSIQTCGMKFEESTLAPLG